MSAAEVLTTNSPVGRLESLVDPDTLHLLRTAVGDGVVAGSGRVDGRPVFLWAQDGSFRGGSLGTAGGETITRVFALAERAGAPVVCFPESGGARVQQGVGALTAYAAIFRAEATARVPVLSVVAGACAGGAAYGAAVGDLTISAGDDVRLFLTGPRVVEEITREQVSAKDLGGVKVQSSNGVIHLAGRDGDDALALTREVLSFLPQRLGERPPCGSSTAATCWSSLRAGRATSSPAWAASRECRSACSPTSRATSAGRSTWRRPRRAPGSSSGATGWVCRWWSWWTRRASCRAPARSAPGSSATGRPSFAPSRGLPFPG
jgi:hypothetical protein